ncbi:unnamed protein product [marine sediment metagenome]|uniref:Uncharacterized protein n=1 Tax=marine sediment metagenome TaxID=412755 RepID=X1B4F3_9ZZZZ
MEISQRIPFPGPALATRIVGEVTLNRLETVRTATAIVEEELADSGDVYKVLGKLPKMAGAAATDYTVYTKKDISLRRGEKAIVTLFVKNIKYSHVYRWSPPERMKHMLVLHNDTDTAWTTGPYLAVSRGHPLSEDLLKYTPKGGNCEIPVTAAVNIAHDKSESEIDRKLKAHSPSSNRYLDLVTLEGMLKLHNFEKKTVDIITVASVPGKPLVASGDGLVQADPTKLKLTERRGSVRWKKTIAKMAVGLPAPPSCFRTCARSATGTGKKAEGLRRHRCKRFVKRLS